MRAHPFSLSDPSVIAKGSTWFSPALRDAVGPDGLLLEGTVSVLVSPGQGPVVVLLGVPVKHPDALLHTGPAQPVVVALDLLAAVVALSLLGPAVFGVNFEFCILYYLDKLDLSLLVLEF